MLNFLIGLLTGMAGYRLTVFLYDIYIWRSYKLNIEYHKYECECGDDYSHGE